jgi:hemerythrin-like domain-containing protein
MADPIRRDPRLVPLSHDHHQALARAREATLAVDGTQVRDLDELARACAAFFDEHLEPHFKKEERYLVPAYAARFGKDDELLDRVRQEHATLRTLTRRLTDPDDTAPMNGRLAAWALALQDHVRFEEREWFESIQNSLSKAELDKLGAKLAEGPGPACKP